MIDYFSVGVTIIELVKGTPPSGRYHEDGPLVAARECRARGCNFKLNLPTNISDEMIEFVKGLTKIHPAHKSGHPNCPQVRSSPIFRHIADWSAVQNMPMSVAVGRTTPLEYEEGHIEPLRVDLYASFDRN